MINQKLYESIKVGNLTEVQRLISNGALVDQRDGDGITPLYLAVSEGYAEIARLLFEKGAGINKATKYGSTPLMQTASKNGIEMAQLLLSWGISIHAKDNEGWTALHCAVNEGHLEMVSLLLDHGAHVDAQSALEMTPLHIAALNGNEKIAQLLLERGATVDEKKDGGITPLMLAVINDRLETVRLLLSWNTSINQKEDEGWTALHCAAHKDHTEIISLLLIHGSLINEKDINGYTALAIAAFYNHYKSVQILLENGADINAVNDGTTILHTAVFHAGIEIIELLISSGAIINETDLHRRTPLHIAATENNKAAVTVLLQWEADINLKDNTGKTALLHAVQAGHSEIADILRAHEKSKDFAIAPSKLNSLMEKLTMNQFVHKSEYLKNVIDATCNAASTYNFNDNTQSRIGHLLKLSFPEIQKELTPDVSVLNPINPSSRENIVAAFMNVNWSGHAVDTIEMELRVSYQNKAMIQEAFCLLAEKNQVESEIEIEWAIYDYDYQEKKYFKRFYTEKKPITFIIKEVYISEDNYKLENDTPAGFLLGLTLIPKLTISDQYVAFAFSARGTSFTCKLGN